MNQQSASQPLDELVEAMRLPYVQRAVLRVQGVSLEKLTEVAQRAPAPRTPPQ